MTAAAVVAVGLLAVIGVFQLSLAAGAPLGRAAWGGQHDGVLPRRLRIASGVAGLLIYPSIAVVILLAAGVIGDGWSGRAGVATMWVLTALFALGAVLNAISRSPAERIWAPVSAGIALCCAIVAASM